MKQPLALKLAKLCAQPTRQPKSNSGGKVQEVGLRMDVSAMSQVLLARPKNRSTCLIDSGRDVGEVAGIIRGRQHLVEGVRRVPANFIIAELGSELLPHFGLSVQEA